MAVGRIAGIVLLAAAAPAAAALAGARGLAAAVTSYRCTGNAAADHAALEPLIQGGGSITLHGPRPCAGNYLASGVRVAITSVGAGVTMDGGGTGSILVASGSTVTLTNLTLTHGRGSGPDLPGERSGDYGGGVSVTDATLRVVRCRIVGNSAEQGGGIHAAKATVKVVDAVVARNTSSEGGGGIDTEDDVDLTIRRSTISGNSTGPHGGGIEAFDGTLTLIDSRISGNSVTARSGFRSGGGVWAGMADLSITRSTVSGNRSMEVGGGIGYSGGKGKRFSVTDSTISGNQAAVGGGGIRSDAYYGDAVLVVDHSILTGNMAGQGGGIDIFALHGFTSRLSIQSSSVAGNRAPGGLGGGIDSYIDQSGGATIISTSQTTIGSWRHRTVRGNRASFGGGIAANGADGTATIVLKARTAVVGNTATIDGGGVFTRNRATLLMNPGAVVTQNRPNDAR